MILQRTFLFILFSVTMISPWFISLMVCCELCPEDAAIRPHILPASRHHIAERCEVPGLGVLCAVRKRVAKTVRSVCWVIFLLDITRACCRGAAALTGILKARRRKDCEGGWARLPDLLHLGVNSQEVSLTVNLLIDLTPEQRDQT